MEPYQVETSEIQWAEEDKSKSTAEIFGATPQMDTTQPTRESFGLQPPIPRAPQPQEDVGGKNIFQQVLEGVKETGEHAIGLGEAGVSAASGLASFVPAFAGGMLKKTFGKDVSWEEAQEFKHKISALLTHEPVTEKGKAYTDVVMSPLTALGKGLEKTGEAVLPENIPLFNFVTEALMIFGGPVVHGMIKSGKPIPIGKAKKIIEKSKAPEQVKAKIRTMEEKPRAMKEIAPKKEGPREPGAIPASADVAILRQKQVKAQPPKLEIPKEEITIDPKWEGPPAVQRVNKAIDNVQTKGTLSEYAKSQEVPGAEHGVVKYKEGGTLQIKEAEALSLMDRSIPDIKAGAVEQAFTPTVWWSKAHPLVQKLFERYHTQDKAYFVEMKHHKESFTKAHKDALHEAGLNPKKSADRIGRYAIGKQKGGEARLAAAGKKPVTELSPAELKVYDAGRVLLDRTFDRINRARELAGQKPLEFEGDYFTFMLDARALEGAGMSIISTPAGKINGFLQNARMQGTKLPYAKARKGIDYPVQTDYFNVLDKYMHDSIKHVHYAPVIARGRAYLEPFKLPTGEMTKAGKPKHSTWKFEYDKPMLASQLNEWVNRIAGKSELSNVKWKAKFQKAGAKLNRNIATAVLSGMLRSALIQVTAWRGAIVEVGPVYSAKGFIKNMTSSGKKFARQHATGIIERNMDIHVGKVINDATGGKIANIRKGVGEAGLGLLQVLDGVTASGVWHSFFEKYKKLGVKEAIRRANDGVLRTQASGKIGDVAPIQSSVTGRLLTLFQTFTIAEWNWMLRDVMGIKNPEANLGRNVVRTIKFIATTAIVNEIFEDLLDIPSPFPAPEREVFEGKSEFPYVGIRKDRSLKEMVGGVGTELLEALPVVGSPIKYSQDWRSNVPGPAVQWTADMTKLLSKMVKQDWGKITIYDLEAVAKMFGLPGASQARKYISGRKRGKSHLDSLMGARGKKEETKKVGKMYW